MEKFEQEIAPKIDDQLRNVDLGYADIFVRLYMVGSRANNSRPIIMVCCTDAAVRANAETEIRRSGLLDGFPEFGIGQSALPLEQPTMSRALVGEKPSVYIQTNNKDQESPPPPVEIGRSLVFLGQHRRYHATGGAILTIGTDAYQLTVGHIGETTEGINSSATATGQDLDECRFDGMSDDENSGGDSDSDVLDVTSRGSRTPDNEGSWRLDSLSGVEDSETSTSRPSSPRSLRSEPQLLQLAGLIRPPGSQPVSITRRPPVMTHIFDIAALVDRSSDGPNPGLDYALVPLGPVTCSLLRTKNEVYVQEPEKKTLLVQKVAEVKTSEARIIAVTAFGGPSRGVLIPGSTFFRGRGLRSFQKLYAIQFDNNHVFEGDCGSVVIGEAGELYGHIVRGCPGTTLAYMVPATEVFADLSARRKANVSLAVPAQVPDIKVTRPLESAGSSEKRLLAPLETNLAGGAVAKTTSSRFLGKKPSVDSDREAMSMIEAEQALLDKEELRITPRSTSSKFNFRRDSNQFGYMSSSSATDTGTSSTSSEWEGGRLFPLGSSRSPRFALIDDDPHHGLRDFIASESAARDRWMTKAVELDSLLVRAHKELKENQARLRAYEAAVETREGNVKSLKISNEMLRDENSDLRDELDACTVFTDPKKSRKPITK